MAQRSLIACGCVRRHSSICRRLDKMVRGALVADVVAVIGTLDIVLGEETEVMLELHHQSTLKTPNVTPGQAGNSSGPSSTFC